MLKNPALGPAYSSTTPETFFGNLIPAALGLLLVIGVVVFLFQLLLGAISWISAGGDKAKYEEAKHKISTALIGITILLSFFAILSLVECFFGIGLRGISVGAFSISFSSVPICQ